MRARYFRTGAVFVDNARDVLRPEPLSELPLNGSATRSMLALAAGGTLCCGRLSSVPALALLFLVAGYQNAVTIPHLRTALSQSETAQTLPSFSLIAENSRGGAPLTISVPAGKPFSFFVDIPPKPGSHLMFANFKRIWNAGTVVECLRARGETNSPTFGSRRTPGIGKACACRARIGLARKARCG